jgi:hypothetical protein
MVWYKLNQNYASQEAVVDTGLSGSMLNLYPVELFARSKLKPDGKALLERSGIFSAPVLFHFCLTF